MAKKYKINKKDIESAFLFLKHYDPDNATNEKAKSMLEDLQSGFHDMSLDNPELLIKLKEIVDKNKKIT